MYWKGNDLDYAAFLDRRRTSPTLYELSRQENDNLDRFRSQTEHWPSIQKQAEEQAAFYAGMSKSDKKLMEMREVMFWRTHRPHVYAMTSAGSTEPAEIGQSVVGKDTERNRLSEEEFTVSCQRHLILISSLSISFVSIMYCCLFFVFLISPFTLVVSSCSLSTLVVFSCSLYNLVIFSISSFTLVVESPRPRNVTVVLATPCRKLTKTSPQLHTTP